MTGPVVLLAVSCALLVAIVARGPLPPPVLPPPPVAAVSAKGCKTWNFAEARDSVYYETVCWGGAIPFKDSTAVMK